MHTENQSVKIPGFNLAEGIYLSKVYTQTGVGIGKLIKI